MDFYGIYIYTSIYILCASFVKISLCFFWFNPAEPPDTFSQTFSHLLPRMVFFMVFVNCHVNGAHGGWGFPFMGDHWKNIGKPQSNVDDLGVPPWLGKAPQPPHLHDFRKACGSWSPVLVRMPNWTGTNQWGRNHGITQRV